jgi:hypothetical protein
VHQMTVLLDLAADARVSSLQQVLSQGRAAGASPALQRMAELALTAAQGQVLSAPATEDLAPPAQALLGLLLAHLQALAGQFAAALTTLDGVSIPALTLAIGEEACQRQGIMLRHTCLLRLGRLDAARQVLDRGLQAGLDRDWLAGRAADLFLHGLADADAACRWLGDVPVQVWQQPFARQDHALALARCGQASRAVDQLDARLAVRADDDDARVALAGVLQAAGDPAGALATLNPLWQRAGLRPLAYRDATQRLLPEGVMASGAAAGVPAQPNDPLVSIVLTLQGPHPHLLASVRSVMAQSWQRLELLLVDVGLPAGWSDALLQALGADPRVRLVRLTPGMGVAAARNAAWLQARGDYLWFSDADAWWHPEALATQVAALQVQPQWLACRHLTLRVDGSGQLLFRPERPLQPGGVSCLLMRRSVVERLGGFDDVAQGFNAEFLQRLVRTWGVAQLGDVPLPLRLTTRHEGSAAAGADLPQHWYGHDVAVDQYLHAARRWLNEAALRTPVLVSDTDERPFLIPPGL